MGRCGTSSDIDLDFGELRAVFLDCTLKRSPEPSDTAALMGGIPAHGNQRAAWDAGARFDHPDPEHR